MGTSRGASKKECRAAPRSVRWRRRLAAPPCTVYITYPGRSDAGFVVVGMGFLEMAYTVQGTWAYWLHMKCIQPSG